MSEVSDDYFGTKLVDPYRWMEDQHGEEFQHWMRAQAAYARRALENLPDQKAFLKRLTELDRLGSQVDAVTRVGNRIFYLRTDPNAETSQLCTRDGWSGAEVILVDPTTLAGAGQTFSLTYFAPSNDGAHVAYGLAASGSEVSTLRVVEVSTGKVLPDVIDDTWWADVSWEPDQRAFFYRRNRPLPPGSPEKDRFSRSRVYRHVLGTQANDDEPCFGYGVSARLSLDDAAFPSVFALPGSDYLIGMVRHGVKREISLFAAPRKALRGPQTPWQELVVPSDEVIDFDVRGSELYLLSNHDAPRRKILRIMLGRPRAPAMTVVAEGPAILQRFVVAKDALYVHLLDAGISKLERVPFDQTPRSLVPLPSAGSLRGLFADVKRAGAAFELTSWTLAPQIFEFDPKRGTAANTQLVPPSLADFSHITSVEVEAKSADGTLVPLSIVHGVPLRRDGSAAALLTGYAAYGSVFAPRFVPTNLAWLEKGGIYAVCHARGGGERGEAWHRAGMLEQKPNSMLDLIACAEYLIEQGYTSASRLAAEGESAGGIMVAGALTRRPDLFGAALIRVASPNTLRGELGPTGPFNIAEFGTVQTLGGFRMRHAIDAYHQLKAGTDYPAVVLTVGMTDPRVAPWSAAKLAAKLQALTHARRPVLLRVDYGVGHGIGSQKSQVLAERADLFAFLWRELLRDK